MSGSECLDDNDVASFLAGRLDHEALARVERHLARCDACLALVAEIGRGMSDDPTADPSLTSAFGAPPTRPLAAGARVGRYEILELVGSGGMGHVYAARDPTLDRKVALKLLRPRPAARGLEARLVREAKAMARVVHPEVITVFDAGVHDGQLFIAMEFVDGGTLRQWLAGSQRPWRDVLAVFLRAGRGLAHAHAAGIIHRDFKPDNVLVGDGGIVRVTDFGLARTLGDVAPLAEPATDEAASDAHLTHTGMVLGTPAYMAPEQVEGGEADARSDVFAFCVALHEGLYGVRPFAGTTLAELQEAKRKGDVRTPADDRGVPQRVRRAILAGLAARPEDRHASMDDLIVALERAARRRWGATLAVGAAIGVTAAAAIALRAAHPSPTSTNAPTPARCASSRACVESHGGAPYVCRPSDGACVPLASDDCTPHFEPEDLLHTDTVWLGAMFPVTGPAAEVYGQMNVEGAELARREIARTTQALRGSSASQRVRPVALVACNDAVDPSRAARHLVDDVGAPAILGFGSGQELVDLAGSMLVQRGVLSVATLSASPFVTRVPQPSDLPHMVFRTTFSLDDVALATARFVHDVLEPRAHAPKTRVALVRVDMAAGLSFAEMLYRRLTYNGRPAVDNAREYHEFTVPPGPRGDEELARLAGRIVEAAPTIVVLLGEGATNAAILEAVERSWKTARRPAYVIASDSTLAFRKYLGASVDRRRRLFAIESLSDREANARFVIRYNASHATAVSRVLNPGVTYDAFYMLAYATFALGSGTVDGASLARAIARLVLPAQRVEVGPSQLFEALTALSAGKGIDLEGTQSGLDFDLATGEAPSDFALLCAAVDASGAASGEDVEAVIYRAKEDAIEGTLSRCP